LREVKMDSQLQVACNGNLHPVTGNQFYPRFSFLSTNTDATIMVTPKPLRKSPIFDGTLKKGCINKENDIHRVPTNNKSKVCFFINRD
jgi:hypothetical protein